MAADIVQAYAAVAGLILALIGLPCVLVQLRELQRSVQGSAHAAMYAQAADFRSHLVAFPHLRKYFFDGTDIAPDHEDYDRTVTIAELFLNYLEHIAVMGDSFGRQNRAALDRFCRHALARSPILRRRLSENRESYSHALQYFLPESTY